MSKNEVVKRMKHIHLCYMFIHEYIGEGSVKIEYVTSEDNLDDL